MGELPIKEGNISIKEAHTNGSNTQGLQTVLKRELFIKEGTVSIKETHTNNKDT